MKNFALLSIPNCAGVKICLGKRAEKIAALYARTVEAAKCKSSKNERKSPRTPIGKETGTICLSVHQVQKMSQYLS